MLPEFETEHLDHEFTLPDDVEELALPDVYVGLEIPLLAPGDGIVTDRHHASADRYEADDPQNQIGGMVSPFPLSGWLRHVCERVVKEMRGTACHPGTADTEYMLEDVYERDLDAGYQERGSYVGENSGSPVDRETQWWQQVDTQLRQTRSWLAAPQIVEDFTAVGYSA